MYRMRLLISVLLNLIVIDYTTGAGKEFEWTAQKKRYLLNIYYITSPDKPGHEKRMKEKWDIRFPEFRTSISDKELRQLALDLIEMISHQKGDEQFPWTLELNKELLKIYHLTKPDWMFHENRMRKVWDEEFPNLRAETNNLNLREHATKLLEMLRLPKEEYKQKKRIPWDNTKNAEIMHIYYETNPKKRWHENKMRLCWAKMHPELRDATPGSLRRRVKELLARGYEPGTKYKKLAKITFNRIFPNGFEYKGKEVIHDTDQASTSYSVHNSESEINNSRRNYPIGQPEPMINQYHEDPIGQLGPEIDQFHPDYLIHQPELEIGQFHLNYPMFSPVRHQEFLNDFNMRHQMANSSQSFHHVPYSEDYTSHHDQHGIHDQHDS